MRKLQIGNNLNVYNIVERKQHYIILGSETKITQSHHHQVNRFQCSERNRQLKQIKKRNPNCI